MNTLDIILLIPLAYAFYRGCKEGVVLQFGGIVALIIGVYLAFRWCGGVARWLGMEGVVGDVTGFLLIVVGIILLIAVIGRLLRGLFKVSGLGMFDQVGGGLLAIIKMSLILSALMSAFISLNHSKKWVYEGTIAESKVYPPMRAMAAIVFPYLEEAWGEVYKHIESNFNHSKDKKDE